MAKTIIGELKSCLDILRNDKSHLTGSDALYEITHFIFLKQIEKHFDSQIDIDNLENYDSEEIENQGVEKFRKNLQYVRFSKFADAIISKKIETENILGFYKFFIWDEILKKHPKLRLIFENLKLSSKIEESETVRDIVLKLNDKTFLNYDDTLGQAYEEIFTDTVYGGGKSGKSELGQFFTPEKVKNLLLNILQPKISPNGEIESVYDPACGTGGILNSVIKWYKKNGNNKEIEKQFKNKLFGVELKYEVFYLCIVNILLNTGHILGIVQQEKKTNGNDNIKCSDTIRTFHSTKVDIIMANPPFSVKIDYNKLKRDIGSEEKLNSYIPVKVGGANSEMLFLQTMIYSLKIGGRCATVMLDGEKMYGKGSGFKDTRELLLKTCDLKEIIQCPPKTFTSTSSKTCILYFHKKKEMTEVVERLKRDKYKFKGDYVTSKVKFYDFDLEREEKVFLAEVDIEDIVKRDFSFNLRDYLKEDEKVFSDFEYKTLGEICDIKIGGTPSTKIKEYYENGSNIWVSVKELNGKYIYDSKQKITDLGVENSNVKIAPKDSVLFSFKLSIGKTAIAGTELYTNEAIASINSKNSIVLNKYIFYYMSNTNFEKNARGSIGSKGSLNKESVSNLKIPIPPLETQQKIVNFLDPLSEKYNLTEFNTYYDSNDKLFNLLLTEQFELFTKLLEWYYQHVELKSQIEFKKKVCERYVYINGHNKECEKKSLGEICDIKQGKNLTKKEIIKGNIKVIGGGKIIGFHNISNIERKTTVITRVGDVNITFMNEPYYLTDNGFCLLHQNHITNKYIFYYLSNNHKILYHLYNGAAQKVISKTNLSNLKIPIPPLEIQQKIVEYCENNEKRIEQLENEIKENETLAKEFLKNILDKDSEFCKTEKCKSTTSPYSDKEIETKRGEEDKHSEKSFSVISDTCSEISSLSCKSSRSILLEPPESLDEKEAELFKELTKNTVEELKQICRREKISGFSAKGVKKFDLILKIIEKRKKQMQMSS